MRLLQMAYVPAVEVTPETSVKDAIATLLPTHGDALAVKEGGFCAGILTSQDILRKVVLGRLDPQTTLVRDVMTAPVVLLHPDTPPEEAIEMMLERDFRHLPLSEDGVVVCGMLSLRRLLLYLVEDQRDNLRHLEAFINADGPGG